MLHQGVEHKKKMKDKIEKLWKRKPLRMNWDHSLPPDDPLNLSKASHKHPSIPISVPLGSSNALSALYRSSASGDHSQLLQQIEGFRGDEKEMRGGHGYPSESASEALPAQGNVSSPIAVHAVLDLVRKKHSTINKQAAQELLKQQQSMSAKKNPQVWGNAEIAVGSAVCEKDADTTAPERCTQQELHDGTALLLQRDADVETRGESSVTQHNGQDPGSAQDSKDFPDAASGSRQPHMDAAYIKPPVAAVLGGGVMDSGARQREPQACFFLSACTGILDTQAERKLTRNRMTSHGSSRF